MKTIKYKIEMLSDWHVGSGLDAGAESDAVVLKNEMGLPYIPGKTIKGLLKDAANEMVNVGKVDKKLVYELFGGENNDKSTFPGKTFFKNAEMPDLESREVAGNNLQEQL